MELLPFEALQILKDANEAKDKELFIRTLNDKIEKEEADPDVSQIDFTGVIFPGQFDFDGRVFGKDVSFREAKFIGSVSFSNSRFLGSAFFTEAQFGSAADFTSTQFLEGANFDRAQFSSRADFRGAHFNGHASFLSAQFGGTASFETSKFRTISDFSEVKFSGTAAYVYAEFSGTALFRRAYFGGEAIFWSAHFRQAAAFGGSQFNSTAHLSIAYFDGEAEFNAARFGELADFSSSIFKGAANFFSVAISQELTFQGRTFWSNDASSTVNFESITPENAQRLSFEGVDLSSALFLRTDVSQTRFVACTWHKIGQRNGIRDEISISEATLPSMFEGTYQLVANTYRQLRLNYESQRQEAEAGDFYIGQMEMRRQDKASYSWLYRGLLSVYRVLAMYGESYQRPVFFYFTFGLLFALLYLWGGFQVGEIQVRYGLGFDPGNIISFGKDFVRAYVQAFTAGGILGANLAGLAGANLESGSWWVPAVRYVNMLLDTFLVGFFVIALRRHFRR